MRNETILYDEKGLVVYSYKNIFKDTLFGFKIYTDKNKKILVYESAGFESYDNAYTNMQRVLTDLIDLNSQFNQLAKL